MIKGILNNIIKKLGKDEYILDDSLSNYDVLRITINKFIPYLRGLLLRFRLKESKGIIFLGRNSKILFKSKFKFGKTII